MRPEFIAANKVILALLSSEAIVAQKYFKNGTSGRAVLQQ
jgi:hypothetical protein